MKADLLTLPCRDYFFPSVMPAIFMKLAEIKYI